jgi:GDP-D-mannose dehydratase
MKIQTILITGGAGQDGIILSKFLIKNQYQVYFFVKKKITNKIANIIYYNIKNKNFEKIQKILNIIDPGVIVHFGSDNPSFKKPFNKSHYTKNLDFTKKLINYSSNNNIKFIFPSSSQIFKNSKNKVNELSKTHVTSYYTKFRIDSSKHLLKIKNKKKIKSTIAILFNHDSKYRKKRFLLPRLLKSIKDKKYGFVKNIYRKNISGDFSHAEDICYGLYLLIKSKKNPNKLIFSSGIRTEINRIIEYFFPKIKKNILINNINTSSNVGNNLKACKILKWKIKKKALDAAKEIYNEI